MQNILELETAVDLLINQANPIPRQQRVPLMAALNCAIAENIDASMDIPPFDRSPLDGYAFAAIDTLGASKDTPARLNIVAEICAGDCCDRVISSGQAVRIMTGAQIPTGCDCVVRQEDISVEQHTLIVPFILKYHENFIFQGEDIKKGHHLIRAGEVLKAAHIGTLASLGYAEVTVYDKPRIALCSTGDELLDIGKIWQPGKIYNSNLYILAARLTELGCPPCILASIGDNAQEIANFIKKTPDIDLFLTTGGVSVGKKDIMHDVLPLLKAKRLFWRIAIKPGSPLLAYQYKNNINLALSGNPFAALTTFELIVRPLLAKFSRRTDLLYRRKTAQLLDNFSKESHSRRFIRAKYENGTVSLPSQNHSSGALFSSVSCNALIDIPAGTASLRKGQTVKIILL